MTRTRLQTLGAVLLLAGLAVLAYAPALHGGFVFDDDNLLTRNPLIPAADGLRRFWLTSEAVDYWPVTMTSFWVEWRLWGMDPTGYHALNLLLHIGDALLIWAILRRLGVPGAYWAALLFAVHPVNVQSVAWIAQRKNTLSLLFFLASIYGFLKTDWGSPTPVRRSPAGRDEGGLVGWKWYALSLLAFVLAMLSKGSVAVLPLVLLGLVAWRRRLTMADVLKVAPFLAVAVALTLVNIRFQNHGLTAPIRAAGPLERLLDAGAVTWFYLGKALLPVDLTFIYPLWRVRPADLLWWLPLLAALGVTLLLYIKGRTARLRSLDANYAVANSPSRSDGGIWGSMLFAWAYFCVALIPVMGLTDIYFMKYSLVADHYEYLALIGVVALVAAGWWGGEERRKAKGERWKTIVAAAVVGLFTVLTWRQAGLYRDAETLYRATLERNPQCWVADNNLGIVEVNSGRRTDARAHFVRALELNPNYAEAHFNLGLIVLREPGGTAAAAGHFARAVEITPRYAEAHYYLGNSLRELGRPQEAVQQYEEALRLKPDNPDAELNLGVTLASSGRVADALPHFAAAVQLNPRSAPAQLNLAFALREVGRVQEGQAHYAEALRLDPQVGR